MNFVREIGKFGKNLEKIRTNSREFVKVMLRMACTVGYTVSLFEYVENSLIWLHAIPYKCLFTDCKVNAEKYLDSSYDVWT